MSLRFTFAKVLRIFATFTFAQVHFRKKICLLRFFSLDVSLLGSGREGGRRADIPAPWRSCTVSTWQLRSQQKVKERPGKINNEVNVYFFRKCTWVKAKLVQILRTWVISELIYLSTVPCEGGKGSPTWPPRAVTQELGGWVSEWGLEETSLYH